jgi:signal transduction histidine kinase
LAFEPTERACQVWGDVSALKQVFVNLLSNAVKFSPDGNVIEIEMEWQEDTVSVSVTDHGLGIPADAMPYLFDRFYRARNVSAAEIHGNGIGLFIVKSLLKELDGSISVDSKVNEGTTFTVILRSK